MFTSNCNGIFISNHHNLSDGELLEMASSVSNQDGNIRDKVLHWDFGPIMEMKFSEKAENYLFSSESVPFHWDGAFYKEPAFLLFYCLESNGNGGETIFSNTEAIWKSLNESEKKIASSITLKYRTEKKVHYGGEISLPLVQKHPMSGNTILRIAEKVETELNPVCLEMFSDLEFDKEEFYQLLVGKLYEEQFIYKHSWNKGDLLIADNFTFLHGRNSLNNNLKRTFKRIQIM